MTYHTENQTSKLLSFSQSDFKGQMDELVALFNTPSFIDKDPVQFPRRYANRNDIEIVAFLTSVVAWGKRSMILNSADKMLAMMGKSPYDFVMSGGYADIDPAFSIHRTFFGRDFIYYCQGLRHVIENHDGLEGVFDVPDIWCGIRRFREEMAAANGDSFSKHVSCPDKSACKRIHLALRWLVRDDGIVDLGIWKSVKPAQLYIPLDIHVSEVSRDLGLLERKNDDRTAVEQLTARLRELDAKDPVKYDFALFGAGIAIQEK